MNEKSVGAIIFRRAEQLQFLLLHYESGHWDFPKGNVEEGETELDTMRREVLEETGINDLIVVKGFKERIEYFYRRNEGTVKKEVIFFLAETKTKDVRLSFEHKGFRWLPFKEAYNLVTFDNSKNLLKKTETFLKKYSSLKDLVEDLK